MCWISGLLGWDWGEGGGWGIGENYVISLFFQKPPPCDCFGTEYNEIIKAVVCLGHLSSFLMAFGQEKLSSWSLLWALISIYVPLYVHILLR